MRAEDKVKEAQYHLDRTRGTTNSPDEFRWNLSAFLSAARSITWLLQNEFGGTQAFEIWYQEKQQGMRRDSTMDFFRHKRNFSVHEAPLTPRQNITVRAMSLVRPDGVWDVRVIKHGKVVERREVPLSDQNEPIELPAHATYTHLFPDFPGGERDVVSACEEYLSKLNSMVSEWKQLGL